MKQKHITCFLLLVLVILSGCTARQTTSQTASKVVRAPTQGDPAADVQEVFPVPPVTIAHPLDTMVADLLVDATTNLPDTLPVYTDLYPSSQAGPKYEVTPELTAKLETDLRAYLLCLYGADTAAAADIWTRSEGTVKAVYQDDHVEISAFPTSILVVLHDQGDLITDVDALQNHEVVVAAMNYLDASALHPTPCHSYDPQDETTVLEYGYAFRPISADLGDAMADRIFRHLQITQGADSDTLSLRITKREPDEAYRSAVIPYSAAISYVQSRFPDASENQITLEAYYDATVEEGYFLPCYKVYVAGDDLDPITGLPETEVLYINMIQ